MLASNASSGVQETASGPSLSWASHRTRFRVAHWYDRGAMDVTLPARTNRNPSDVNDDTPAWSGSADAYFSADVETDGPIPGPYSILSFAIVYAGSFDGSNFLRPPRYDQTFYRELRPISENFESEALRVNGLDRQRLCSQGEPPEVALTDACQWVKKIAGEAQPVLVAYPLSFDWSWLYWYFVRFSAEGSPFEY